MATFDDLVEQGNDILAADTLVDAAAHYKLPAWLRAQLSAAVASAGAKQDESGLAEGTRRAASTDVKAAYADGEALLREFNRFVNNVNDNQDAQVDIPAVRADYGLGRVLTSDLTHPFVKSTLQRIQRVAATTPPPTVLPRASVLTRIEAILAVIDSQGVSAGIGDRSQITGEKLAAQDALEEAIARVRLVLQGTLPLMFKDPLLHNYGFVPRQETETEEAKPPTVA